MKTGFDFLILIALSALLCAAIIQCGGAGDDDDDDDDDQSGVCDGEPGYIPGDPYPRGSVWAPAPGATWQWQIDGGDVDQSFDVQMYDVDLFEVSIATIGELQDAGRIVICYFSAGSWEDWREDAQSFPTEAVGNQLDEWAGENWLDIRNDQVRELMKARLASAYAKGCDGVEPDNMDGYSNDSGFDLTPEDQIDYNRFIADEAHKLGLSVGLKNDICQIENLIEWYDWALNEQCVQYGECDLLAPFIDQGRAVFHVEYVDDWSDAQAKADAVCGLNPDFSTIVKHWDLDERSIFCWE